MLFLGLILQLQNCCSLYDLPIDSSQFVMLDFLGVAKTDYMGCAQFAMKRGFFRAINQAAKNYSGQLEGLLQILQQKKLYYLDLLGREHEDELLVEPYLMWGQSEQEVMVRLKLSLSAEGGVCSRIFSQQWNFKKNQSFFELNFRCSMQSKMYNFDLKINFLKEVKQVRLLKQGVGIFTLKAKKQRWEKWGRLRSDKTDNVWEQLLADEEYKQLTQQLLRQL